MLTNNHEPYATAFTKKKSSMKNRVNRFKARSHASDARNKIVDTITKPKSVLEPTAMQKLRQPQQRAVSSQAPPAAKHVHPASSLNR